MAYQYHVTGGLPMLIEINYTPITDRQRELVQAVREYHQCTAEMSILIILMDAVPLGTGMNILKLGM